jgi:hypothetical protein
MSDYLPNPMNIEQASFLALYCACLTTTLHLMDDDTRLTVGFTTERANTAINIWNELLVTILEKMDWAQNHRIESLQAYMSVLG